MRMKTPMDTATRAIPPPFREPIEQKHDRTAVDGQFLSLKFVLSQHVVSMRLFSHPNVKLLQVDSS